MRIGDEWIGDGSWEVDGEDIVETIDPPVPGVSAMSEQVEPRAESCAADEIPIADEELSASEIEQKRHSSSNSLHRKVS